MAKKILVRRGTTAQHSTFTGSLGEVTMDTDKKTLVIHDGVTPGGMPMSNDTQTQDHINNTSNPHSVTKAQVGLGNVQNVDTTIASNIQQNSTHRFVTDTEKSTWNVKQDAITGGATTITSSNLTASRALVSDASGKVAVSAVTSTELGYVYGVTSAIQTQLNSKAPLASPALTGTPTAPTATAGTNTTQIATTAFVLQATGGTWVVNDSRAKTALNASGAAPIYACRAWVNFNGTTTPPTIRASGNVSSVTINGTGNYTVNFTTAMPDANYSTAGCCTRVNANDPAPIFGLVGTPTASAVSVQTANITNARENVSFANVAVLR